MANGKYRIYTADENRIYLTGKEDYSAYQVIQYANGSILAYDPQASAPQYKLFGIDGSEYEDIPPFYQQPQASFITDSGMYVQYTEDGEQKNSYARFPEYAKAELVPYNFPEKAEAEGKYKAKLVDIYNSFLTALIAKDEEDMKKYATDEIVASAKEKADDEEGWPVFLSTYLPYANVSAQSGDDIKPPVDSWNGKRTLDADSLNFAYIDGSKNGEAKAYFYLVPEYEPMMYDEFVIFTCDGNGKFKISAIGDMYDVVIERYFMNKNEADYRAWLESQADK